MRSAGLSNAISRSSARWPIAARAISPHRKTLLRRRSSPPGAGWASCANPTKLRSWLCGIVRNLAAGTVRRDLRRGGTPQPLDAVAEPISQTDDPEAEFVTREEEAILWRALAGMPNTYREPMVLFYREEQSIADVAAQLDLSEDAVKQRLSRGRAMLREEMAALVESALTRSRPTAAFTASVMGALTLGTGSSASAAGTAGPIVATAAKSVAGSLGAGAVAGPLAGLLTAWLSSKAVGLTARSEPERALIAQAFAHAIPFVFGMIALLLAVIYLGLRTATTSPWFYATTSVDLDRRAARGDFQGRVAVRARNRAGSSGDRNRGRSLRRSAGETRARAGGFQTSRVGDPAPRAAAGTASRAWDWRSGHTSHARRVGGLPSVTSPSVLSSRLEASLSRRLPLAA